MKMNKVLILFFIVAMAMVINVNAATCTLNRPAASSYDSNSRTVILNATATWSATENLTGVNFTAGTFTVFNNTVNGTQTTGTSGDFTYTISTTSLSEGALTTRATCHNSTQQDIVATAVNSTSVTWTIDKTNAGVVVSVPYAGSTIIPSGNIVTFEYTPTDTNLANCSLYLGNQLSKQSSTQTTSPNVTSGAINRFTQVFASDNTSLQTAVRCIDLAGNPTASSATNNFTFSILTGGIPFAVANAQAAQSSGAASSAQAPGSGEFAAIPYSQQSQNLFQQYAWIIVVFFVAILALAIRLKWFK